MHISNVNADKSDVMVGAEISAISLTLFLFISHFQMAQIYDNWSVTVLTLTAKSS